MRFCGRRVFTVVVVVVVDDDDDETDADADADADAIAEDAGSDGMSGERGGEGG